MQEKTRECQHMCIFAVYEKKIHRGVLCLSGTSGTYMITSMALLDMDLESNDDSPFFNVIALRAQKIILT